MSEIIFPIPQNSYTEGIYQMLAAIRIYTFNAVPYLRISPIDIYIRTLSYEISHRIYYHTQQLSSLLGLS